jgi:hypothetical protein
MRVMIDHTKAKEAIRSGLDHKIIQRVRDALHRNQVSYSKGLFWWSELKTVVHATTPEMVAALWCIRGVDEIVRKYHLSHLIFHNEVDTSDLRVYERISYSLRHVNRKVKKNPEWVLDMAIDSSVPVEDVRRCVANIQNVNIRRTKKAPYVSVRVVKKYQRYSDLLARCTYLKWGDQPGFKKRIYLWLLDETDRLSKKFTEEQRYELHKTEKYIKYREKALVENNPSWQYGGSYSEIAIPYSAQKQMQRW